MSNEVKTYTAEETAEHRKQWVEALRSGKYEQGKSRLRLKSEKFCCLGVACDISGLGEWVDQDSESRAFVYQTEENEFSSECYMPTDVADWLGIDTHGSLVEAVMMPHEPDDWNPDTETPSSNLATTNDLGKDFEGIAEIIESGNVRLNLKPYGG